MAWMITMQMKMSQAIFTFLVGRFTYFFIFPSNVLSFSSFSTSIFRGSVISNRFPQMARIARTTLRRLQFVIALLRCASLLCNFSLKSSSLWTNCLSLTCLFIFRASSSQNPNFLTFSSGLPRLSYHLRRRPC